MPFSPDTTITDIKSAIGSVATNQITGISRVYVSNPDGPPENGSIVVGTPTFQVEDDTSCEAEGQSDVPMRLRCQTKRRT
jgi:hypothetical protein